jgi:hypothetical protein
VGPGVSTAMAAEVITAKPRHWAQDPLEASVCCRRLVSVGLKPREEAGVWAGPANGNRPPPLSGPPT